MQKVETRQSDLREMQDLTYSRFDARFDQFEARLDQSVSELRREMQVGFAQSETRSADLRREIEKRFGDMEIRFERRFNDLMKWSFTFWIGSLVTLMGALTALQHLP